MQCIQLRKVSLDPSGKTITQNPRRAMPGLLPFHIPCRKCLPCLLNQAREKAVRCWHESKMHQDNIFLTLTYDELHLESPWLIKEHFQSFFKNLRSRIDYETNGLQKIFTMYTGEYGEKTKRPHWHAIIFNFRPDDAVHLRTSDRGEKIFTSEFISSVWGKGLHEFGDVTIDSASYVARYAAKSLCHGDSKNLYRPVHETPKRHPLGKTWIEKYCEHPFTQGFVILPNGQKTKIPRYYVDWCKKNRQGLYEHYVTTVLPNIQEQAEIRAWNDEVEYLNDMLNRASNEKPPLTRSKVNETILKSKFKKLQERLKL